MAGEAADDRWRSGAFFFLVANRARHEQNEIDQGINKYGLQSAAHPAGSTFACLLPKILALGVLSGPFADENHRHPDDKDADVQHPDPSANGQRLSVERE